MTMPRQHVLLLVTLAGVGLTLLLWHMMGASLALDCSKDFLNYWGAPQLAQQNTHSLMAGADYEAALQTLCPHETSALRWSYPLYSLFFFAPFAALPYVPALVLWLLLGLGLYVAMLWGALPCEQRRSMVRWLLVSPIVMVELITRQNGFFIGAAALAVLLLLQHKRPIVAGVLLGCLTIKPQLFILWPIMLVVNREWRCLVAASLTAAVLGAASLAVHGVAAWQEYLAVVPKLQWQIISAEQFNESRKLTHLMMPGITPALLILGVSEPLTHAVQWLVSLGVLAASIMAFRRPMSFTRRVLLLASGGLLISPYGFNYDMTLLCAGMVLLWAGKPRLTPYEAVLGGLIYLLPLLVYVLNVIAVPAAPVLLCLLFVANWREVMANPRG